MSSPEHKETLFNSCSMLSSVTTLFSGFSVIDRGGSRTAAKSKMECFVIIVNGCKSLTLITKRSILDAATVLDPSLIGYTFSCDSLI